MWGGRYHRRDLATPSEVRNTLLYVLQNRRKRVLQTHGNDPGGFDAYSSARWFDGWEEGAATALNELRQAHERRFGTGLPIADAEQWLTRAGWRRGRGGILRITEVPRV